jgi:cytochrome c
MPAEFQQGEAKFKTYCAHCHGERAAGTHQGPPLVHKIYEPSHHGDAAFQMAAAKGVRAHHWGFGDMPKIEGVSSGDVTDITAYIRWLQRKAGIQ